jgi:hypothetical protein
MIRIIYITLFHSLDTHHMYFFQIGGNRCFNHLCSGFVQVNQKLPLGYVLKNISIFGADKFAVRSIIFKVLIFGIYMFASPLLLLLLQIYLEKKKKKKKSANKKFLGRTSFKRTFTIFEKRYLNFKPSQFRVSIFLESIN